MVSAVLLFQHRSLTNVELSFQNVFGRRLDHYSNQIATYAQAQGDPSLLCRGCSAFLIFDLTFHGQWHSFRVRCQPSCSGKFAWRGHLVKRTITPVEVVKARCQTCSSMLCLLCDRSVQIPTPKAAAQHLQPCRCIASSAMNRRGQRRKLFAADDAA